ncbi:acyl-CoA synthetase FdrA [Blastococcus jejuensis]|uniref:Acyl-CoA synthetase FdrA n=1 Tax=Blastococcus jejuensis TaxID=351224 RepID=A0ABP6P6E1_9ACTN
MTVRGLRVHRDTYLDSLLLMATTVTMDQRSGVSWAGAVMASPRGREDLAAAGFPAGDLDGLDGNDLVLAVTADDEESLEAALDAGREAAFAERREATSDTAADAPPADIAEAVRRMPGMSVAVVSVPGEYAALEAHHALTAGLHVLLFSDNVPVEEEVELKDRALRLGRLVMGPGAGTAVLAGTGLGFANVLSAEPSPGLRGVGVVAAAGTGAQEVSTLLDRWGVPVTQVIGVGGRDLTAQVGGRMARSAVRALDADPDTGVVLLVSKPPDPAVAETVLAECRSTPAVAVYLGLDRLDTRVDGSGATVRQAPTLEAGVRAAAALAGAEVPVLDGGLRERVAAAGEPPAGRTAVRGLFSGGTLCYEAQYVLERLLGPVWSNEPLRPEQGLPAPDRAHVLLDLGAEEYTRGRPHPMIDPERRLELLREAAADPTVAVVLLDVVLGLGSAEDPAGRLAPVCAEVMAGGGPLVVAYLLGTEADPQGYPAQRTRLEEAGCLVAETNAQAARAAAALVLRRPELLEEGA